MGNEASKQDWDTFYEQVFADMGDIDWKGINEKAAKPLSSGEKKALIGLAIGCGLPLLCAGAFAINGIVSMMFNANEAWKIDIAEATSVAAAKTAEAQATLTPRYTPQPTYTPYP